MEEKYYSLVCIRTDNLTGKETIEVGSLLVKDPEHLYGAANYKNKEYVACTKNKMLDVKKEWVVAEFTLGIFPPESKTNLPNRSYDK